MIIMIDTARNMVVGQFENTKEALKYAKEEIKVFSFETCKGGEMHGYRPLINRGNL